MNKIYKSAAVLSIAIFLIFSANIILAQTQASNDNISGDAASTESSEIPEEIQIIINEDENIVADDLEIKEPALLPGNPFYFVKGIGRGLKSAITFNSVKKAELKLRFANERLIEIQKVTESNNNSKLLEKALDKYEKELDKIEKLTEKIKEKNSERTEKFIDKFIDNQIKHQKLLNKIENEVPKEIFEKIQENRQTAIQTLSDVSLTLIDADRFQEKIEERMENQNGSDFKNFKNLEILKDLENKVPEVAKDAIKRAQENTLQRLNEKIQNNEKMMKNLIPYIQHINIDPRNEEKYPGFFNELMDINKTNLPMFDAFEKAKEINVTRIKNRIEREEPHEWIGDSTKNAGKDNDINNSSNDIENEKEYKNEDTENKLYNNDVTKNSNATTIDKERLCAQVITPARNQKTGECRKFPTACLPVGWYKARACEKNQINSIDKNSDTGTNNTPTE